MSFVTWPLRLLGFVFWYIWLLFTSNFAVLKDNLTPGQDATPGVARYLAHSRTEFELTLIAALITLTPGTLTLGTNLDAQGRRVLYVHSLYNADADELRGDLAQLERRMLHALRRKGMVS